MPPVGEACAHAAGRLVLRSGERQFDIVPHDYSLEPMVVAGHCVNHLRPVGMPLVGPSQCTLAANVVEIRVDDLGSHAEPLPVSCERSSAVMKAPITDTAIFVYLSFQLREALERRAIAELLDERQRSGRKWY